MLKMFKRLKGSVGYIVLIFALLFLQAYCDLSLPSYTSKIVDVGIQQKGIEDGVPDKIRAVSLEALEIFMSEEERDKVENAYTKNGDIYERKELSSLEREELNSIFSVPMMILLQAEDSGMTAEALQNMPQEQLAAMQEQIEEAKKQIESMPESIVTQSAVAYVQQEYADMGENVDRIQMNYVLLAGLKMLGMALLIMVCAVSVTFLSSRLAAKLGHDLRNQVYRKVISFSNSEMDHFSTASLITRSTNDIQQVQMMFAMLFRIVLYAPILGVGGVLKVLETESSMTWILAVAVGLILVLVLVLMIIAMPKFNKLQTLIDRLNLVAREILTGIPVIRAFSREKHEEERFEVANRRLMKTNLFVNRVMTVMMPVMMLIMNGITVLIVYSGSHAVDQGQIQVGSMMAFIQYTMQIIMSFLMITMLSVMLPRAEVSAKRINEVLATKVQIENPKESVEAKAEQKGTVEFKDVTFSYPGAEENVLSHISFEAKKGETVAFIGSTGSGKSTLVNLIPRFYDVTEGKITIDGKDIRDVAQRDLRDRLGYVPQKGVLFSGDIASNILYGNPDGSEAEMEEAAQIAQAEEFISHKKKKYHSPIAQGGSNVSGGQKQRLSIARAIAKHPDIYIFDDSFSALDYKTDVTLRQALKQKTKDSTVIIVAQRISTILHAEQIIVLDDGKVAGIGTHKELLKNCEAYYQIAASQLSEKELEADMKEVG